MSEKPQVPRLSVKMACGHFATSLDPEHGPYCAECAGSVTAWIVQRVGGGPRPCRCTDCGKEVPGDPGLPFYRYRDELSHDSYYCGCHGMTN